MFFHARHDLEQFAAGFVEVDEVAFAAEHRRGGAEVAAHRTSHGRDQRGRRVFRRARQLHAHGSAAESRVDLGVDDQVGFVLAEKPAEPGYPFSTHDVVRIDPLLGIGQIRDMPAHHYRAVGLMFANQRAHLSDFADVGNDRGDADDVVFVVADLLMNCSSDGKSRSVEGAEMFSWIIMMPQER